jgi:hypothetical protein
MRDDQYYEIRAYLCKNYAGLMDSYYGPDRDFAHDFIHENAMKGNFIEVLKHTASKDAPEVWRINPDMYIENFENYDGEFPYPEI